MPCPEYKTAPARIAVRNQGLSKTHPLKGLFPMARSLSRCARVRKCKPLPLLEWAEAQYRRAPATYAVRHIQRRGGFAEPTARLYAAIAGYPVEDKQ